MSRFCQKCGGELSEDTLFCSKCGEKVAAFRCPSCGKRLPEDSAFCTYCGAKIVTEQAVSPQSEVQQADHTAGVVPTAAIQQMKNQPIAEQSPATDVQGAPSPDPEPVKTTASLSAEGVTVDIKPIEQQPTSAAAETIAAPFCDADNSSEPDYTGDLSDVIIKNTQYYLPEFEKAKRNEKCRFNWSAFFFNGIFAYYRKSQEIFWHYYKWPIIIYAVIILGISGSGFLAVQSDTGLLGWSIAVGVLSLAINIYLLIVNIRFGKSFNKEYYQHCMVRAESSEITPRTVGTSVKNAILYWIIMSLCVGVISVIAGGLISAAILGGMSETPWTDNDYSTLYGDADEDAGSTYLLKKRCYEATTNAILNDPTYVSTLYFHDYEDGSPLSEVSLTDSSNDIGKRSAIVTAAADYTYDEFYNKSQGTSGPIFRWYFTATVDVDTSQQGDPVISVVNYSPLDGRSYVLDDAGNEIPADEWLAANNDRTNWDYDDYVSYYGFDPADYGYEWYNEIRNGPLDEFFEMVYQELSSAGNDSRLYTITDPYSANLTPDDFIGRWVTNGGIVFTIEYYNGEYSIDFTENNNLSILGGWFSENTYNIEGAFSGMAGSTGVTSFSVSYEYGTDYPTHTWLTLDITESDGNEIIDYVSLT